MLKNKLYGMMTLIVGVILVFSLIGCDNGTTGDNPQSPNPQFVTYVSEDSNGNLYTLVITENTKRSARYTAKDGDSFTFTVELFNNGVYSVALTYSGTVESAKSNGTEIAISVTVNGKTLNITVNGTVMTVISGEIVDNQGETVVETPETLTPTVDKRALETAITTANRAKEGVVVSANGTDVLITVYWVSQARMDTFTTAISTSQAVFDNTNADQSMVDYSRIAIETATTTFNGQKRFGTKTATLPKTYAITWVLNDGAWNGTPGTIMVEEEIVEYPDFTFILPARIIEPDTPVRNGYVFQGWYTETTFQNKWDFSSIVTDDLTLYAKWNAANGLFSIGDTGPGGGIVFYVDPSGFGMFDDDNSVCRHLEVSLDVMLDKEYDYGVVAFLKWASPGFETEDIPTLGSAIGLGRKNTALILATDSQAPAAKACNDYRINEEGGWYLPCTDELWELYKQRDIVPGLNIHFSYWSSTQRNNSTDEVWAVSFYPEFSTFHQPKYAEFAVYAIRAF